MNKPCPKCKKGKLLLLKQCCDDPSNGCRTTHYYLENPFYRCDSCLTEFEQGDIEEGKNQ